MKVIKKQLKPLLVFVAVLVLIRAMGVVHAELMHKYGVITCGKVMSMSGFDSFSYEFLVNGKAYRGKAMLKEDFDSLRGQLYLIKYNSYWPKNHSIFTNVKLDSCEQVYQYDGLVSYDSTRIKVTDHPTP